MAKDEKKTPADSAHVKGRPTRSRKEAEAARQRPLVPTDRKAAKEISRQKREEAYRREREALETGNERYLPVRDKGKVRRYYRDYIDARWSISEFLLPGMLIFLAGMLVISFVQIPGNGSEVIVIAITAIFYGLLFMSIIESLVIGPKIKKRVQAKYPNEVIPKGTWFYMYSRMLMARRWRSPKPQVARGEFPK